MGIWESSDIRTWLNQDFLAAAFTTDEQHMIMESAVENGGVGNHPATIDKVFLLSKNEAETFFPDPLDRRGVPTAYAVEEGISRVNKEGYVYWWLRSCAGEGTGRERGNMLNHIVDHAGGFRRHLNVPSTLAGLRPVIWLRTAQTAAPVQTAASVPGAAETETAKPLSLFRHGIRMGDSAADVKKKESFTLVSEEADGIAAIWQAEDTTLRGLPNSTLSYCFNKRGELFQVYEYFNPNVSRAQGEKEYAAVQAELEAQLGSALPKAEHVDVTTPGFDVDDFVATVKAHKGDISITDRDMWVVEADGAVVTVDHVGTEFGGNYKHYLFFLKTGDVQPEATSTPTPAPTPTPVPTSVPTAAPTAAPTQVPAGLTEVHTDKGAFGLRVDNVHVVSWKNATKDRAGAKMITVQCVVENIGYSGMYKGALSNYEIGTEELCVEDDEGFLLEFYGVSGGDDGLYEVGAKTPVGKKKRISLPFFAPEGCQSVTVSIGDFTGTFALN